MQKAGRESLGRHLNRCARIDYCRYKWCFISQVETRCQEIPGIKERDDAEGSCVAFQEGTVYSSTPSKAQEIKTDIEDKMVGARTVLLSSCF